MKTGICKLCKKVKNLVKAHIIPRSFTLRSKGNSKEYVEIKEHDTKTMKNWQNGVWDDQILCAECEKTFQSWDEYGFKVFGNLRFDDDLHAKESGFYIPIYNIDYIKLSLFILSLLWKSSVSNQSFFSKVNLGKHEPIIEDILLNKDTDKISKYPIVIYWMICNPIPASIFAPYRQRSPEGINFIEMFLPSIKITIKVDQRPIPMILERLVLKQQEENVIFPMLLHPNEMKAYNDSIKLLKEL